MDSIENALIWKMTHFGLKIPVFAKRLIFEKNPPWKPSSVKNLSIGPKRSIFVYSTTYWNGGQEKLTKKNCVRRRVLERMILLKNYAWRIFFVIGSSNILSSKFTFWEFLRKLEFLSLIQLVPKWLFSCGDYSGIILVELQWVIFVKVPQSRRGWWLRLN